VKASRGLSRRRFLTRGLGGLTALGLGAATASEAAPVRARGDRVADAGPRIRVALHHRLFNGQDLRLSSFLDRVVAPAYPGYAGLLRAGAPVAEALAWALAPSGAAETWHLEELAHRRRLDLSRADDPQRRIDRDAADLKFREALCIVLPGTAFFRLYLQHLGPRARAILGRPAETRLARMAHASTLAGDDVDFLTGLEDPGRPVLATFRRLTYHRYLGVPALLGARDGRGVDLVVAAMAPPAAEAGLAAPPTPLRDQMLVLARIVHISRGRVHALVQFDAEASDALAVVQEAVVRHGFIAVTLSHRPGSSNRQLPRALVAWCEDEDVPLVVRAPEPARFLRDAAALPWLTDGRDAATLLGLRQGRRARARLDRFHARQGIAAPPWLATLDEMEARRSPRA
jgi:hypothetical protein